MPGLLEDQPKPSRMAENQGIVGEQPDASKQAGGTAQPEIENADMFVANGLKIIHNEKISDSFIKRIVGGPEPIKEIADFTLFVIDRLESSAGRSGIKLQPGTLAQVANVLMGEIMTVAETAGMEPLSEEDRYSAFSLAVSKYLDDAVKSGKMSKEEVMRLSEEAKQTPEGQKIMNQASGGTEPMGTAPNSPAASMER